MNIYNNFLKQISNKTSMQILLVDEDYKYLFNNIDLFKEILTNQKNNQFNRHALIHELSLVNPEIYKDIDKIQNLSELFTASNLKQMAEHITLHTLLKNNPYIIQIFEEHYDYISKNMTENIKNDKWIYNQVSQLKHVDVSIFNFIENDLNAAIKLIDSNPINFLTLNEHLKKDKDVLMWTLLNIEKNQESLISKKTEIALNLYNNIDTDLKSNKEICEKFARLGVMEPNNSVLYTNENFTNYLESGLDIGLDYTMSRLWQLTEDFKIEKTKSTNPFLNILEFLEKHNKPHNFVKTKQNYLYEKYYGIYKQLSKSDILLKSKSKSEGHLKNIDSNRVPIETTVENCYHIGNKTQVKYYYTKVFYNFFEFRITEIKQAYQLELLKQEMDINISKEVKIKNCKI